MLVNFQTLTNTSSDALRDGLQALLLTLKTGVTGLQARTVVGAVKLVLVNGADYLPQGAAEVWQLAVSASNEFVFQSNGAAALVLATTSKLTLSAPGATSGWSKALNRSVGAGSRVAEETLPCLSDGDAIVLSTKVNGKWQLCATSATTLALIRDNTTELVLHDSGDVYVRDTDGGGSSVGLLFGAGDGDNSAGLPTAASVCSYTIKLGNASAPTWALCATASGFLSFLHGSSDDKFAVAVSFTNAGAIWSKSAGWLRFNPEQKQSSPLADAVVAEVPVLQPPSSPTLSLATKTSLASSWVAPSVELIQGTRLERRGLDSDPPVCSTAFDATCKFTQWPDLQKSGETGGSKLAATHSGLFSGQRFRVRAATVYNIAGRSYTTRMGRWSDELSTLPGPPSWVLSPGGAALAPVVVTKTNDMCVLSWEAPRSNLGAGTAAGGLEYDVWMSGDGGSSWSKVQSAVSNQVALVEGLAGQTQLSFKLEASSSQGRSGFSATSPPVSMLALPTTAPLPFCPDHGQHYRQLTPSLNSAAAVAGATAYRFEAALTSGFEAATTTVGETTGGQLSFKMSSLFPTTTYYLRVTVQVCEFVPFRVILPCCLVRG